MSLSRLILGAVQLGLAYGVANRQGQPSQSEANAIVMAALEAKIRQFDTAQAYGESEQVLGSAIKNAKAGRRAEIITKLSPDLDKNSGPDLEKSVRTSLSRLGVASLDCVMLHREDHLALLDDPAFAESFAALRQSGLARWLGCSVYTPKMAKQALEHPLIDIVQLPASIFDRRFEQAGIFDLAARLNKEIHIRSALLQGVLCMAPKDLPHNLAALAPYVEKFGDFCRANALPPSVVALKWLIAHYPKAKILFGAESAAQVRETAKADDQNDLAPLLLSQLDAMTPPQDDVLLNPALWSR